MIECENYEEEVAAFRTYLAQVGCESEVSDTPERIALDVPPTVKHVVVEQLLDP